MARFVGRVSRAETLAQKAYAEIKKSLITGRRPAGERITIRALADDLGTSPTPVREALARLLAERALASSGNGSVEVPLMSVARLREIGHIRGALEGLAVEFMAVRRANATLVSLYDMRARAQASLERGDWQTAVVANQDFHFAIYHDAGHPLLVELIENLWVQIGYDLSRLFQSPRMAPKWLTHYADVMAAIRQRDGQLARTTMTEGIELQTREMLNSSTLPQRMAAPRRAKSTSGLTRYAPSIRRKAASSKAPLRSGEAAISPRNDH